VKILHVISSIDPRFGGVSEAVLQSSLMSRSLGHDTEILSLDAPDAAFLGDFPVPVHALGPAKTGYAYTDRLVPWLRRHAGEYRAVIVNGLWQYHTFGTWRALRGSGVPYFVFTHGMLDPWFKRAYPLKHARKWLYWPWAEYRVLRDARSVLFTCEEERRLARDSFWLYRVRETVAAFGTRTPPADPDGRLAAGFLDAHPELKGRRLLLFLGRLHEKKGCDLLIDAFARVAAFDPRLQLVMAGPDLTGWQATLQAQAAALGLAARVTFPGMLKDDTKWGAFHASEAYVLPSHQENFGIAVAEAMGCGLPVLLSDKVNIWREIQADGAGFVDTDSVDGCERTLRQWLALDEPGRATMRAAARASFHTRFTVKAMAQSLVDIIEAQAPLAPVAAGR
jgi:glycosyltransferase involved in cell wall biosynthesis